MNASILWQMLSQWSVFNRPKKTLQPRAGAVHLAQSKELAHLLPRETPGESDGAASAAALHAASSTAHATLPPHWGGLSSSVHALPLPVLRVRYTTPSKAGTLQVEKNHKHGCASSFWRTSSSQNEHGSLHGSAGHCKHGYHGIKDGMASTDGTSGWTHVDARWVPRSKKSLTKRHHITTLFAKSQYQ